MKDVTGRSRRILVAALERCQEALYPLDYDYSWLMASQTRQIMDENALSMPFDLKVDADGFMVIGEGRLKTGHIVLRQAKGIKEFHDHRRNLEILSSALRRTAGELSDFEKSATARPETVEECVSLLVAAHRLLHSTAYLFLRYAVFPRRMLGESLDKRLMSVGDGCDSSSLLFGLSCRTSRAEWDMTELAQSRESAKDAKDWARQVQSYLAVHGNMPITAASCFTGYSWKEKPEYFLKVLAPLLQPDAQKGLTREKGELEYELILRELCETIGTERFERLQPAIHAFRKYYVYEQEALYCQVVVYRTCRRLMHRLAALTGLPDEKDLLYLRFAELCRLGRAGALTPELTTLIERRKSRRGDVAAHWEAQKENLMEVNSTSQDAGAEISSSMAIFSLYGEPAARGQASGPVCLIRDPEDFGRLKKGDIIVCPAIIPEWASLFSLAAAVISDSGSRTSVAAVAARRYGIPAVFGCSGATYLLSDGDEVRVNGRTGIVVKNG